MHFVRLIINFIFKRYVNLDYAPLLRDDVIQVKLKVHLGIELLLLNECQNEKKI